MNPDALFRLKTATFEIFIIKIILGHHPIFKKPLSVTQVIFIIKITAGFLIFFPRYF